MDPAIDWTRCGCALAGETVISTQQIPPTTASIEMNRAVALSFSCVILLTEQYLLGAVYSAMPWNILF